MLFLPIQLTSYGKINKEICVFDAGCISLLHSCIVNLLKRGQPAHALKTDKIELTLTLSW